MIVVLTFQAGDERYAIHTRDVKEIVPHVKLRPIAQAPQYVAGVFCYRGAMVPVIDLTALLQGRPSREAMSTRIVLVHFKRGDDNAATLGLIAEQVLDIVTKSPDDFLPGGVTVADAPYLGDMTTMEGDIVQVVTVDQLLPAAVAEILFADETERA